MMSFHAIHGNHMSTLKIIILSGKGSDRSSEEDKSHHDHHHGEQRPGASHGESDRPRHRNHRQRPLGRKKDLSDPVEADGRGSLCTAGGRRQGGYFSFLILPYLMLA